MEIKRPRSGENVTMQRTVEVLVGQGMARIDAIRRISSSNKHTIARVNTEPCYVFGSSDNSDGKHGDRSSALVDVIARGEQAAVAQ